MTNTEHLNDSVTDHAEKFAGYDRGDDGRDFDEYMTDEDLIKMAAHEQFCGC